MDEGPVILTAFRAYALNNTHASEHAAVEGAPSRGARARLLAPP